MFSGIKVYNFISSVKKLIHYKAGSETLHSPAFRSKRGLCPTTQLTLLMRTPSVQEFNIATSMRKKNLVLCHNRSIFAITAFKQTQTMSK